MKGRLINIFTMALLLCFGTAQAQLFIGPTLSGGMTYGKNFIISDTSQYYIGNAPAAYYGGGLDILYSFNENIRAQVGVQYSVKNFNLQAPSDREGLSFTNIERSTTVISVPMTVHYRIPLGESNNSFNIIAGHSLDFTSEDSMVVKSSTMLQDSGLGWTRHEYQNIKRILPTVLLGAGADIVGGNGNVLNLSLVWGLGTGRIFRGNIAEWDVLNQAFDPEEKELPEEFPEHYFDFALRGSTLSLKVSYWFDMSNVFQKKDDSGDESMEE